MQCLVLEVLHVGVLTIIQTIDTLSGKPLILFLEWLMLHKLQLVMTILVSCLKHDELNVGELIMNENFEIEQEQPE